MAPRYSGLDADRTGTGQSKAYGIPDQLIHEAVNKQRGEKGKGKTNANRSQ